MATTYAYDLAGRTTSVSDTSPPIHAISTAGAPLSFTTSTTYDAQNRPTGISYDPAPAATTTPAAFTPVTFSHAYNKVNQRTGQAVSDNAWIDYPAAANGLCYTSNSVNQYTGIQSVSGGSCSGATISPTYDGNANLTSDGAGSFTYDAENRLTRADVGGTVTDYQFDGRGRRTKKQPDVGAGTIFVTGADNRELLEYDAANGTILRWYAYGLGPNDVIGQMNVGPNTRAAFIPDMLGSVIGTQDAGSGTITKFGYGTYGSSAAAPSNFAYTGQRIDQESSLYYYRARHYSPFLGRFNQTDSIGHRGGMNLYAYVDNDPLNLLDPDGEIAWFASGAIGAALGVGVELLANYSSIRNQIALGNWESVGYQIGAAAAGGFVAGATGVGAVNLVARAGSVTSTLIGGGLANVGGNTISQVAKIATGLQDSFNYTESAFAFATGSVASYAPAAIKATPGGAAALRNNPAVEQVIDAVSQSKGAALDLLSKPFQEVRGIMSDAIVSPAYAAPAQWNPTVPVNPLK